MAKLSKEEWNGVLDGIATQAGYDWLDYMHENKWFEANDTGRRGTYETVLKKLKEEYPYTDGESGKLDELKKTKPLDWWRYARYKGAPDPRAISKAAEMKDYLPLLRGVADEGTDWLSIEGGLLQDKSINEPYNFDRTREDFNKFLGKLAEYQKIYDRGNLAKEYRNSWQYPISRFVFPTMTKAGENAIATGDDLSADQILSLALIDGAVDVGQLLAPGMNVIKSNPVLNSVIGAGAQGVLEAERQLGGAVTAGVDPEASDVVLATALGMTRPGMLASAQGIGGSVTGPEARQFWRGFARSSRAGNPVEAERAMLSKRVDAFNNRYLKEKELIDQEIAAHKAGDFKPMLGEGIGIRTPQDGLNMFVSEAEKRTRIDNNLAIDFNDLIGLPRKADGTLDKDAILRFYDSFYPMTSVKVMPNGRTVLNEVKPRGFHYTPESDLKYMRNNPVSNYISSADEAKYRALIGAKIAELEDRTPWANAGMFLGTLLNAAGSRIEPTLKINPFSLNIVGEEPYIVDDNAKSYQESSWYKKLSPDSQAIIDEAFKKKEKK